MIFSYCDKGIDMSKNNVEVAAIECINVLHAKYPNVWKIFTSEQQKVIEKLCSWAFADGAQFTNNEYKDIMKG